MVGDIVIYVADAGSVSKGNFSWTCSKNLENSSKDIDALAVCIADDLRNSRQVALGFECVLFIPCPERPTEIGTARNGECTRETGNRPFTAPAGACSTMTGLPALAWVLKKIKELHSCASATTRWSDISNRKANLFVWEAFVSGFEKGASHHDDARLAVEAFQQSLPNIESASRVTCDTPVSLAGALILTAQLSDDNSLLSHPCIVIRPIVPQEVIETRIEIARTDNAQKRRRKNETETALRHLAEQDDSLKSMLEEFGYV